MDGNTPTQDTSTSYRVLARKYRPSTFDDLIGQEPMVRTLTNAFSSGRIAQAWMLTGVRGVGKTSTARILARALNYAIEGEVDAPTIDLARPGDHCEAIMQGRHVDVIEMDAASHTSIDDIRDLTDAARYTPVSARYKVYIIDEVHMLSKAAFNGLLKTLEEPPPHVKFIFATTEIRKVPVTVLSRCQRFDLRRIDVPVLIDFLKGIAAKEEVEVDDEAFRLIARAGEGSARDSLSILDQAIAHGAGEVTGVAVRDMLGLADRGRVIDLFEHVLSGQVGAALTELKAQYDIGADPSVVLADLADFTHLVTRMKFTAEAADDPSITEAERSKATEFSQTLSVRVLSRAWQIMLKGISEVRDAPKPLPAADMVLVRLCHAADLPTPDEALKALKDQASAPTGNPPLAAPTQSSPDRPQALSVLETTSVQPMPVAVEPSPPLAQSEPAMELNSLTDIVALASSRRDPKLKFDLERYVRPIAFEPGRIEIALTDGAPATVAGDLGKKLTEWTDRRWIVSVNRDGGGETLHEIQEAAKQQAFSTARADPLVADILSQFPGAEIVAVRSIETGGDDAEETNDDVDIGPTGALGSEQEN